MNESEQVRVIQERYPGPDLRFGCLEYEADGRAYFPIYSTEGRCGKSYVMRPIEIKGVT